MSCTTLQTATTARQFLEKPCNSLPDAAHRPFAKALRRCWARHRRVRTATAALASAGILLLAMVVTGCARPVEQLCPVSGKVTFQDKPVSAGVVRFSNAKAAIDTTAEIQSDGSYSIQRARGAGLPAGDYSVAVMPSRTDAPVGSMVPISESQCAEIPSKYRKAATSGLTLSVKPGSNTFDIDMRPQP
jgi:hypothetical protein